MSLRYRTERARNGMIADPSPLNLNNNEFAGEFGGYLQRDNIPYNVVTGDMVEQGAFTRVIADPQSTTVTLDDTSQEWQVSPGGQDIHDVTDSVDTDSVLLIEWSGGQKFTSRGDQLDAVRYHITVNGVEIASTGFVGVSYEWGSLSLNGTIPVQAGPFTVRVEAMWAKVSQEIASPGIFTILGGVNSALDITERELIIMVRSR